MYDNGRIMNINGKLTYPAMRRHVPILKKISEALLGSMMKIAMSSFYNLAHPLLMVKHYNEDIHVSYSSIYRWQIAIMLYH